MEFVTRETTSEKVLRALKEQGRKKIWLSDQFKITPQSINNKLRDNNWSVAEIMLLKSLLNID